MTVYDELGRATSVELRWAKTANATPGDPAAVPPVPAVEDTWSLFVAQNTGAGTGQVAYVKATDNITFGPTGQMASPADGNIALPDITIGGTRSRASTSPLAATA
ncbi:Flagellar hook protein FlgE OS=Bosea thiooxidans OX=53254 GN=ARD30_05580 PE=3 SV=1 [Bosea thiooxidans]